MKNLKHTLWILLVALFAMSSCGGSKGESGEPTSKHSILGEWKLDAWGTLSTAEIYVSFNTDGTFDLYQHLYSADFVYLNGRFSYANELIDGVYADTTPWGSSYKVSFDKTGAQMTFTATKDAADQSLFVKTTIPAEIRALKPNSPAASAISSAEAVMESRAGQPRFF